ncbi:hypothetical protein O0L34_g12918 [Tuta absoluta]|nr:hypothetical protein O0L34_g12918 [Tuta absoluta]
MSKCSVCDKKFAKNTICLMCSVCDATVHAKPECTGLSAKQITALRNAGNLAWTCNECNNSGSRKNSFVVGTDDEDTAAEDTPKRVVTIDAKKFMDEVKTEMNKILKHELVAMTNSITYNGEKLDECLATIRVFKQQVKDLEKKNAELTNKNNNMEVRIAALEQKLNETEQKKLDQLIEVTGVPKNVAINLSSIKNKLAETLDVNAEQVVRVAEVPSHPEKPKSIILHMQDAESKTTWLSAVRDKKKDKTTLVLENLIEGLDSNIAKNCVYIREVLTTHHKQLLWKAKQELKSTFLNTYGSKMAE